MFQQQDPRSAVRYQSSPTSTLAIGSRSPLGSSTVRRLILLGLLLACLLASGQVFSASLDRTPAHPAYDSPYTVLAFWSSACGYCPKVMANLEKLRHRFRESPVEFLAVSTDGEQQPERYLERNGIQMRAFTNGSKLMRSVDAPGFPWVVIVNARGDVVANPSRRTAPANVASMVEMDLILRGLASGQTALLTQQ